MLLLSIIKMKGRKLGLVALIIAGIGATAGGARAGDTELVHYTFDQQYNNERVTISDEWNDGVYAHSPPPTLLAYVKDPTSPTDGKRSSKNINPQNTNAVKIDLDSENVLLDTEHYVRVRIFSIEDYATRNLTLYQEPNNANADPNLYDVKDLTVWGTGKGWINLPNISSDPNFNHSQFIFRADNYADLDFSGKVNLEDCAIWASNWLRNDCSSVNHWCDFADLDRDSVVDSNDFARMANEWGYDTDDPNTW